MTSDDDHVCNECCPSEREQMIEMLYIVGLVVCGEKGDEQWLLTEIRKRFGVEIDAWVAEFNAVHSTPFTDDTQVDMRYEARTRRADLTASERDAVVDGGPGAHIKEGPRPRGKG
jgi:hypothetical protein